ncbi:MAG: 6-phosphogluconolactonase [Pseudomonadota bacterium]
MAVASFNEYRTGDELAEALSAIVARQLLAIIEENGFASLALSGGSTPLRFLQKLGEKLGDQKDMLYVAPVDERFVPATHEKSNEKMIRQMLGVSDQAESEFLSLASDGRSAAEVAQAAEQKLIADEELPFDVLTLGMGTDGHTASFFPGSPELDAVMSETAYDLVAAVMAPGAEETQRITMTLPVILSADLLILHIEGAAKYEVYQRAMNGKDAGEMPIRSILHHEDADIHVFYAP